ncbi:Retrovirus-related Pol poly from transposon [Brachionus plicatilis]|uniref:Retrovirus-related Pol poly from transposon n=1 Tax=Brachionus plicatilis TaxID=10195 RepID=A0A3M7PSB4_BRAPC|nr:Retrovirus-related Pol poly from transposon [Brachionus plicatilis]
MNNEGILAQGSTEVTLEQVKPEGKIKRAITMAQNTITCGQFRYAGDSVTLGQRWETWLERFNLHLATMDLEDDSAKAKAVFLILIGEEAYEVYKSLKKADNSDTLEECYAFMNGHFTAKRSRFTERQIFRRATKNVEESMDEFHMRLRQLATYCQFKDLEEEILQQLVAGSGMDAFQSKCTRSCEDMDLKKALELARGYERTTINVNGLTKPTIAEVASSHNKVNYLTEESYKVNVDEYAEFMRFKQGNNAVERVVVIKGKSECLLSYKTATKLNIIKMLNQVKAMGYKELKARFPKLFGDTMGMITGVEIVLEVDPNIKPIKQKLRPIAFHLRTLVEEEIKTQVMEGILERVDENSEPTEWISNLQPARILRWALRLEDFEYEVVHKPGLANEADFFSRQPTGKIEVDYVQESNHSEVYVALVVQSAVPDPITLTEIINETKQENDLLKLAGIVQNGTKADLPDRMKEYKKTRVPQLSVGSKVFIKQERQRKSMTKWDPEPFIVKEVKHSMVTVIRDGKEVTRNSSFFTPVVDVWSDSDHEDEMGRIGTEQSQNGSSSDKEVGERLSEQEVQHQMEQLEAKASEQTNTKEKRGRPTKAQSEAKRAAEDISLEVQQNSNLRRSERIKAKSHLV